LSARPGKVKTWVWVVVAILGLGILTVIVLAGAGLYFFSRHIETGSVSAGEAEAQFMEVHNRFNTQTPLIELDERGRFLRSNPDRESPVEPQIPASLFVLAYDARDGQIVRVSVPFWLLRLQKGNATIDLGGSRVELEDLKLTVEDLERFGPTLIVDHRDADGARVLVWSQ
jgi:hypothetical protein